MPELSKNGHLTLKCLITVVVIFVVYARQPALIAEPRFWAEEGVNYFAYAYDHSWLDNLFTPQYGYNTLYNSIATSLATLVPLEDAPAVTTYLALMVQLSVSLAVIWWDIPFLDTIPKKFAIAVLMQTLAYARIWATTIGVQYWLCVLSLLILLYNHQAQSRRMFVLHNGLLVMNGLTGILSCLLIPAFALKAVKTKSRRLMTQTVILTLCLLVQIAVFLNSYLGRDAGLNSRFGDFNFLYVLNKMMRFLITAPFYERYAFSTPLGETLDLAVRDALSRIAGPAIYSPQYNFYLLEMALGLATVAFLLTLAWKKIRQLDTQLLAISILLVTVASTYLSVNSSGGPRYTFAPSIMIMLLVVGALNDKTIARTLRYLAAILIVLSLINSLRYYRMNMLGGVAYDASWPKWQDEVRMWKTDHSYPLKIWPPGWAMTLLGK
ncbi:MAG: hypothetical protein FIA91_12660 [Geobacter sp.]|nr:hypothetical protein [Geobacter sp.]